jgi:hypothetical protein
VGESNVGEPQFDEPNFDEPNFDKDLRENNQPREHEPFVLGALEAEVGSTIRSIVAQSLSVLGTALTSTLAPPTAADTGVLTATTKAKATTNIADIADIPGNPGVPAFWRLPPTVFYATLACVLLLLAALLVVCMVIA